MGLSQSIDTDGLHLEAIDDDENYDVTSGALCVMLSYKDGKWTFWGVGVDGDQFGGTQIIGPGPFKRWLDAEREDALAAALGQIQRPEEGSP